MDAAPHGGTLGRQAERVPAHRVEHVEALRALEPGHHVAKRIVAHMAHMDAPRRIGEHLEHVVFGPRAVDLGAEDLALLPDRSAICSRSHERDSGTCLVSSGADARRGADGRSDDGPPQPEAAGAPGLDGKPQLAACRLEMRSCRARVSILSSSSVDVFGSTGASSQCPASSCVCRNTLTLTPSARSTVSRIWTWTLRRSFGAAGRLIPVGDDQPTERIGRGERHEVDRVERAAPEIGVDPDPAAAAGVGIVPLAAPTEQREAVRALDRAVLVPLALIPGIARAHIRRLHVLAAGEESDQEQSTEPGQRRLSRHHDKAAPTERLLARSERAGP